MKNFINMIYFVAGKLNSITHTYQHRAQKIVNFSLETQNPNKLLSFASLVKSFHRTVEIHQRIFRHEAGAIDVSVQHQYFVDGLSGHL